MNSNLFNDLSAQYQATIQAFANEQITPSEFLDAIKTLNKTAAENSLPLYMNIQTEAQATELRSQLFRDQPVVNMDEDVSSEEEEISDAEISDGLDM